MKTKDVNKSDFLRKGVCFGHGLKASLKSDGQLPPQLSPCDTTRLECRSDARGEGKFWFVVFFFFLLPGMHECAKERE